MIFERVTGRPHEPGEPVEELWNIVGRRGGKTRAAATVGVYIACLCDHTGVLAPGERGVLPILAASTEQATRAFHHVAGVLESSPVLRSEIADRTADTIRLKNSVDISIRPANFRTIRGITAIAAVADELAFWSVEGSANPDREILDALRPALATTGGPLIVISTPYAKRGELYGTFRRHYGSAGDKLILVAKAASRTFNPTLKQSVIDRAYERDPAVAASEYGGEFRSDIEAFIGLDAVEACVARDVAVRAPLAGVRYFGFVDPSGGSQDSMTMSITHNEGNTSVLDYIGERRPPFSPDSVVAEFAEVFNGYCLTGIRGDRYAGEWPRERFRVHGIDYLPADKTRSEIYLEVLPLVNSRRVELLDNPRLVSQLCGLERRTARSGRDLIDHAPGAHDDVCNSACGALTLAHRMKAQAVPIVAPIFVTIGSPGTRDPTLAHGPEYRKRYA